MQSREITEPLLGTLLAISDVREIYYNLQALPFIDATAEGLVFQNVVRETISKELQRRDPERYRKLRRRAYSSASYTHLTLPTISSV